MRRALQKIEIAYYLGRRVGLSDAINLFYEQNGGVNQTNLNMTALIRKEYLKAQNQEATAREKLAKCKLLKEN